MLDLKQYCDFNDEIKRLRFIYNKKQYEKSFDISSKLISIYYKYDMLRSDIKSLIFINNQSLKQMVINHYWKKF